MPMSGGVVAAAPEAGPLGSPQGGNGGRNGGGDNAPGPGGSLSGSVGHRCCPLHGTGKAPRNSLSLGGGASLGCRWRRQQRQRQGGSRVASGRGRGGLAAVTDVVTVVVARQDPRAWTREEWTTTPPSFRSSDNAGTAADGDAVAVVDVFVIFCGDVSVGPVDDLPPPTTTAAVAFGSGAQRLRAW